jgi:AraC family transcriptional regulator of adaptative response / DNA-3-methyladenine glycosylase II
MMLDPAACYRALVTRDARFDGRLFVGVRTTGIYCRPICPAQTPKPENVAFYPTAAAVRALALLRESSASLLSQGPISSRR